VGLAHPSSAIVGEMDWLGAWNYFWEAIRTHPSNFVTLLFALSALLVSVSALRHSKRHAAAAERHAEEARRIREANQQAINLQAKALEAQAASTKLSLEIAERNAATSDKSAAAAEESARTTRGAVEVLQTLAVENSRMRVDSFRPIVTFDVMGPYIFSVKNIGKGPALDIELRLTQVKEDGHLTNLRNFFEKDNERHLMNIGAGGSTEANGAKTVYDYVHAIKPPFAWGVKGVFAIVATYMDINGNPYFTLTLFNSVEQGGQRFPILKRTKTGRYDSGDIEILSALDWIV
jgi:hypothetical protein